MAVEIILEPAGMTIPGGAERIAKALTAFNDDTAEVANAAEVFLDSYDNEERGEWTVEINDLRAAITKRGISQDELLRAVAGRKAVA